MSSIDQRAKLVLSQVFGVPIEVLTGDSSPDTIEQWDSVSHINLILALEQEFGVLFTTQEVVELESVSLISLTLREKEISDD